MGVLFNENHFIAIYYQKSYNYLLSATVYELNFPLHFIFCYAFQVQVLTAALNNAQTAAEHAQQVKINKFLVKTIKNNTKKKYFTYRVHRKQQPNLPVNRQWLVQQSNESNKSKNNYIQLGNCKFYCKYHTYRNCLN